MRNRIIAATIATAALCGMTGFTAVAASAAEPGTGNPSTTNEIDRNDDPAQNLGATNGFNITNLSHRTFTFEAKNLDYGDEYPLNGTKLRPGDTLHMETLWQWGKLHNPIVSLTAPAENGKTAYFGAYFSVKSAFFDREAFVDLPNTSNLLAKIDGTSVTLLDPAGTVVDLPSDHGADLVKVLKEFCGKSDAECSFTPTKRFDVWMPREVVGSPVINTTNIEHSTSYTTDHHVGQVNSVGGEISAEAEVLGLVKAGIKATYSHDWIEDWTFSQAVNVTLPPESLSWVTATEPLNRVIGDFTVKYHNITWTFKNAHFDEPKDGGLRYLKISQRPLTQEELEESKRDGQTVGPIHQGGVTGAMLTDTDLTDTDLYGAPLTGAGVTTVDVTPDS